MIRTKLLVITLMCIVGIMSCSTESTPVYTLTTTASPTEAGTITPESGSYDEGEVVNLRAVPNDGWVFLRWGQDLNSFANPTNVTMDREYTVVGFFQQAGPRDTETEVVDVTNPATGQTWMDRNLGASRVATSMDDELAYGDLYQWGRPADGHQKRSSGITGILSNSDLPGHGKFIVISSQPYDWRSPQNDQLWQRVKYINNPCPDGYRLPTETEWEDERQSWSSNDRTGAFESPLKLPVAGYRQVNNSLIGVGFGGLYWSSTFFRSFSRNLLFDSSGANITRDPRARGLSVRCIKD